MFKLKRNKRLSLETIADMIHQDLNLNSRDIESLRVARDAAEKSELYTKLDLDKANIKIETLEKEVNLKDKEITSTQKAYKKIEDGYLSRIKELTEDNKSLKEENKSLKERVQELESDSYLRVSLKEGKIPKGQAIGSKSPVQSASRSRIIKEVTKCN